MARNCTKHKFFFNFVSLSCMFFDTAQTFSHIHLCWINTHIVEWADVKFVFTFVSSNKQLDYFFLFTLCSQRTKNKFYERHQVTRELKLLCMAWKISFPVEALNSILQNYRKNLSPCVIAFEKVYLTPTQLQFSNFYPRH